MEKLIHVAQQAYNRGDLLSPAVPCMSREASTGSAVNKAFVRVTANKPGCRSDMGCVLRLVMGLCPQGRLHQ